MDVEIIKFTEDDDEPIEVLRRFQLEPELEQPGFVKFNYSGEVIHFSRAVGANDGVRRYIHPLTEGMFFSLKVEDWNPL